MTKSIVLKRSATGLLMGVLPAMLLALIGYIGSFTRYMADDYCSVYWAQRFGLARSMWHWYITWSGRFSAYASDWFVMLLGARNVRFVPPIMLAIWLAVTIAAVYQFLRRASSGRNNWLIAVVLGVIFLFTVFVLMPSIQTSFYWWNGMRSYTLPLMGLTAFAVLYQWGLEWLKATAWIILGSTGAFILLFATGGLSDTYAVAQLGLLSILALLSLLERPRPPALFAVLAAGAAGTAAALLVIALAPGNVYREASFPTHPGILKLMEIAAQGYGALLQGIVTTPAKVLALAGALCGAAWAGHQVELKTKPGSRAIAIAVGVGVLLSFGAMLPSSWGLSEPSPDRTLSVPIFALVGGLMSAAFAAGDRLLRGESEVWLNRVLAALAIVTLGASAIIAMRGVYSAKDTYIQYAQKWDAEHAQILEAKASGVDSVTVTAWPNWAGLNVLGDHSKNWLNQCTSGYYGIEVLGRVP